MERWRPEDVFFAITWWWTPFLTEKNAVKVSNAGYMAFPEHTLVCKERVCLSGLLVKSYFQVPMSNWDWSQLDIGIDPNIQLGSIPIGHWDWSHWDWSQCPIGINPNWALESIPVGFFCWNRDQFHKNFFKNLDFLEGTHTFFCHMLGQSCHAPAVTSLGQSSDTPAIT